MDKTLIGKNGYLFLQNDSGNELKIHNENLCLVHPDFYKRYEPILDKFVLIVFPNKCLIYSEHLPDTFDLKYRPGFDLYSNFLKDKIIDGFPLLKNNDTYYKTDTHVNAKGGLIIYYIFIDKINKLFNLDIVKEEYTLTKKECSLMSLGLGIGDLTNRINLGNQLLENINDVFYKIDNNEQIYCRYKFTDNSSIRILNDSLTDVTNLYINNILTWDIISNCILYVKNPDKKYKVVIFYDSFLLSTLQLYTSLFHEIYFIKDIFYLDRITKIQPDYIFEFRCERFLF